MFLYKNQIGVGLSDIWISFSIGDDRSIDHIGTQSLSCRLSGGDSSTSGQGSGTSGATTGQIFIMRFHTFLINNLIYCGSLKC